MSARPLQRVRVAGDWMWTLLPVPREESLLSARARNDDAAVGVCERYHKRRPRVRRKVAEASLARFPKYKKLFSARCACFFEKNSGNLVSAGVATFFSEKPLTAGVATYLSPKATVFWRPYFSELGHQL